MKKVLSVILSALMLFLVTACSPEDKNGSNVNDSSQIITSSSASQEKESDDKKTDSDDKNSNKTQNNSSKKDDENKTNVSKPSLHTHTPDINGQPDDEDAAPDDNNNQDNDTEDNDNQDNTDSVDNGVLEKASYEDMKVPENMKFLGTNNAKEKNNAKLIEARVTIYELDGGVVEWITEKDLIYVITQGNNRLVVIDSKTMVPKYNTPLAGKPAEINIVGDKIYVSMPDLCRIDIFTKSNLTKVSSLSFEHEVSSFCVDGDYIYYAEHDQHCEVFKKNIKTNELKQILADDGDTFSEPKLYLNKEDNILYIGETASSGSALYYYDATTLKMKGVFRKNNYGIFNHTKSIFHIDDEIFWGNYRFSDTDIKQIIGKYGEDDTGSVNFASKQLVSTFEGIFLTDTYECIVNYFDANFKFQYILVTESNNVFFRQRSYDNKVIIGVNFSIQ